MNFYEYVPLSMSGSEESSITNWTFTIPKGSTMSVQDTFVTIVCPRSIDYEMKTPDGSAGDSAKTFMFGALNGDNNVSCICLAKDGLESPYTYYDAILYGIFSNVGNFSEGQPIVTANSYQGSGSIPLFKLGEAGATTTSITDDSYTNYTTTEKLSKLTAGLYYVNTDKLSVNLKGIDIKSQISTLFPQTNVDDTISVEKGSQITVTVEQTGSPETGYQTQKLVNIYNTTQGFGYPYSIFFVDAENNPNQVLVSMGADLINTALSYSYSAANQLGEIMNTCITDESLRGKVPVISAPDEQTATGVKNVFKAMDFPSGVPITTINTTNKSEFTTLKGILDHPDGMYLVDDCGVTNGDPQLTIAPFKGHCSTVLLASKAQFQKITDSTEMECYKGSVIYVQTDGDISDSSATRYVSIYNVPIGVSGEPSDLNRALPDAGTSVVNIEIYPVEDRSHYPITYSYDIDGGTKTFFTHPGYASLLNSYANAYVAGGLISGKSSYSPGQLIQVVNDTDSWSGECMFTGVDASEFKSPFTLITNENATNYNTLDKLCHLDDGLYLCKDTYKTNQDYIVDITFKGMDVIKSVSDMYSGAESTSENTTVRCKNGCLISVSSITSIHKNIRITQSAEETDSNVDDELFGDIYISAKSDDGSTIENPIYGVTGDSVNYIRPFTFTSVLNTYYPSAVLSNAFGSEAQNLNGKLAKWQTSGQGVVLTGVDITLIGNSTAITPAQVLAAVNEGKTTTISHTDTTYGKLKFTSFGVVNTASGDTVSSSITYGTSADSLMLFTLMGDVTKGTWTMYSRNLTVSA
jgi:hypothetical protein